MCCLDYDRTHIVRNKWGQVSSNSGSWLLPRAMFKSHSNLKWIETGGGRQVDLSPYYLGKISLSQRNYKVYICLLDPSTITSMDFFFFFLRYGLCHMANSESKIKNQRFHCSFNCLSMRDIQDCFCEKWDS